MALSRSLIAVLLVLTVLVHLPFLDKGITYDDIIFLEYAQRLSWLPIRCEVSDYFFQGVLYNDYNVFESTHPPLIPYYLKILVALFGEVPWLLHLGFLPLNILTVFAFAALFTRYTKLHPGLSLGLTLGPLVLPNATSLMTDVPLVGFWCAAMIAWEKALDSSRLMRSPWTYVAGVMSLAAIFTAYQGLGLLVVLLGIGIYRGRFQPSLMLVGGVFAVFIVWLLLVFQAYGLFPYFAAPRDNLSIATEVHKGLVFSNMFLKAKVSLLYLGAALGSFALVWLLGLSRVRIWGLVAACGWALALVMDLFGSMPWNQAWWPLLLFALGAIVVALVALALHQAWRKQDVQLMTLLIWVAGFFGFQILLAPFAAPRYVLAGLAPLFLLLFMIKDGDTLRQIQILRWLALLPMLALGLLVARAEYRYAEVQRVDLLALPQLEHLYVLGEKGVKFSAEEIGLPLFRVDRAQQAGYLLVPTEIDRVAIPHEILQFAEEVQRWELGHRLPIRVMQRQSNAGFYIHTRGLLPFSFSNLPVETYRLLKVFHLAKPNYIQENPDIRPAGPILPETPLVQQFECTQDGLMRIQISMATYGRSNASQLQFKLEEVTQTDVTTVVEQTIDARTLQDNSAYNWDFPLLADSAGKTYRLTVSTPDATPQSAVTVWSNRNVEGSFSRGEEVLQGTLNFNAFSRPGND
jgi:hypothetical protein